MMDLRFEGIFPALEVPIENAPAAFAAILFLLLAIFTLTLKPSPFNTTARFTFSSISSYWFYRYGHTYQAPTRSAESDVSIICTYGIFRNIETSFGYLRQPLPQWVTNGAPQEIPDTFLGRLLWSLDLLFSMRGTSWFSDTHWDFVPAALIDKKHSKPRWNFVRDQLVSLVGQVLLVDLFDTTVQSQAWPVMPQARHPITTLSPLPQIYYVICVCMMTALSLSIPYTTLSIGAVAVGSPTANWPPLFDDPFRATSLHAFWTHKWHAGFRRVFLMVSAIIVDATKPLIPNRRIQSAFRGLCVFALSCILHLALMYRIRPPTVLPTDWSFIEGETMLFFLLQPVGVLLEITIVNPLAVYTFGSGTMGTLWCGRVWTWVWLVWTGRYWSDVWVRHGMWGPDERVVGYSLFRGLLHGNWVQ